MADSFQVGERDSNCIRIRNYHNRFFGSGDDRIIHTDETRGRQIYIITFDFRMKQRVFFTPQRMLCLPAVYPAPRKSCDDNHLNGDYHGTASQGDNR